MISHLVLSEEFVKEPKSFDVFIWYGLSRDYPEIIWVGSRYYQVGGQKWENSAVNE